MPNVMKHRMLENGFDGHMSTVDGRRVVEIRKAGVLYAVARTWHEAETWAGTGIGDGVFVLSPEYRGVQGKLEEAL